MLRLIVMGAKYELYQSVFSTGRNESKNNNRLSHVSAASNVAREACASHAGRPAFVCAVAAFFVFVYVRVRAVSYEGRIQDMRKFGY